MSDVLPATPLFDASGMRETDRWTIEEAGVPSLDLMERAGEALADAVAALQPQGPVRIVCGKGNNGGDGFVVARLLRRSGFDAELLLLAEASELSGDAAANRDRWEGPLLEFPESFDPASLDGSAAIVDAVFGTGFDGEPREPARSAIEAINDAGCPVVACDIASGVDASTGEVAETCVRADLTVSFHGAKIGQRIAPGKHHTGELRVADIGIPREAPEHAIASELDPGILRLAPRRGAESSKFSSGEVLVVGGSRGMTGAVCMSAMAAVRAGAGYATVGVPDSLETIFEIKLTEVMSMGLPSSGGSLGAAAASAVIERSERSGCVVLGPGLGRAEHAFRLARELVPRIECPLLLDADGLNSIGTDLGLIASRQQPTVLTPHAGELARLLGIESAEVNARRLASARRAAAETGAIVILKGDDTIVTAGERIAVNALAAPGLATAGTGDVLSGVVGALVARGMDPFEAASAGVLAHARAGARAAELGGTESVIATDVIEALPAGLAG